MAKKLLLVLVVAALVGAFVYANLRSERRNAKPVETGWVAREDIEALVEASGRLRPAVSVDLSSDVMGRVVAVGAEEGDTVKKGQLLVQVDALQYELRVMGARTARDQAESRLRELRSSLAQVEAQFRRDERLYREQLLPESSWDQSRTAVEMGRAQLESAELALVQTETSLAEAEDRLSKTRILAPMGGVVVRKEVEVGEIAIQGTISTPGSLLMTIADLSAMETEVEVDETDVVHIAVGQAAEVELDAFPERKFEGEVTEVARSAVSRGSGSQQSADYEVVVTLTEADPAMRPGLSATASITTETREQALAIPIQALVVRKPPTEEDEPGTDKAMDAPPPGVAGSETVPAAEEGGETGVAEAAEPAPAGAPDSTDSEAEAEELEGVFVFDEGVARFRPVEVGIAGEKVFEVVSGLEEDEEIITGSFQVLRKLKHGDEVKHGKKRKKRGDDEDEDE